jgi:ATP-dependent RNA helicase HelY
MFDATTAALIRQAPAIRGVDPATLPQDLTQAYAELVALRLREGEPGADAARELRHDRLLKVAAVYEALVDTASDLADRRGAAFVAGTAYQILGRVGIMEEVANEDLLAPAAIHPDAAAPLLFLIAGQSPDAREAGRRLQGVRTDTVLISAMLETIADLAAENFEEILARAERLQEFRPTATAGFSDQAAQTLYGLCWSGVVQMVAGLLDRPVPVTLFRRFELPEDAFRRVEALATEDLQLPGDGGQLVSTYAGPRHLARLLRHVAGRLAGTGLTGLPAPAGSTEVTWRRWLRHRAKTKPVIWPNHRPAIDLGILQPGVSAVLVLPTGAGKTTLSELKIAATVSRGKKVIFLVPTLALVDQLRDDLAASFPRDIGGIVVSADGDLAILAQGPELSAIEVMTPERFLALLSFAAADVSDVGLIVFDECHILSPTGGGSRSIDAMLCLLHAVKRAPEADLLLLSAMLTNGQELAGWLANLTARPAHYFHDQWKPSRQARGVVMYPRHEFTPIYQFIRRRHQNPRLKPPEFPTTAYALFGLQQNWAPNAPSDTKIVRLLRDPVMIKAGTSAPAPNANEVGASLAEHAAGTKLKTILFVQQATYAPSTAKKLSGRLGGADRLTATEQAYIADISAELGGITRSLVNPRAGAVPHNGDMLPLERRLAESLFRRVDGVNIIVATPTLAQGINLPAQLAILAGNKRHDDGGREDLDAHEILNAAGRAGRAGHLANGAVLLVPEPVVGFDPAVGADQPGFLKLQSILPKNDQCVVVDDPLERLLDLVHAGDRSVRVRYFMSRLRAGEDVENANVAASALIRSSFAAYRAIQAAATAQFDAKVATLDAALAEEVAEGITNITRVSAFAGLPATALAAISERLGGPADFPNTVTGWVDWLVDFLRDDEVSRDSLFDGDASLIKTVARGKKTGGDLTAAEFERFRAGLHAWISGLPFEDIERALGVPDRKIRACARARDLVLKIVNRKLYIISSALAELAKVKFTEAKFQDPQPAVLEILAYALRRGLDTPEKVAFAHHRPGIRSRVAMHRAMARQVGVLPPQPGALFRDVLRRIEGVLAFLDVDDGESPGTEQ